MGAWIACRRRGIRLADFADALAPPLVVAQALGRWGNYFNQELFGGPSTLPWALRIDPAHRPATSPTIALYQPTFLYESLWDIGVAVLLVWAGHRFALSNGRLFALYVAAYTVGRAWIERCAWTTSTTSSACASTTGPASSSSSPPPDSCSCANPPPRSPNKHRP